MQQLDEKTLRKVLGEVVADEIKVIHERLGCLGPLELRVNQLVEDTAEMKADVKIIKAVVIDHNNQLDDHEHRLMHLEAI